jgi:hypothetical protein
MITLKFPKGGVLDELWRSLRIPQERTERNKRARETKRTESFHSARR